MTGDMIDLDDGSEAWLFGNTTRNGSASGLSSHVSVDGTSSITYAAPSGYPDPVPPGLSDFTHLLEPEADSYIQDGEPTVNHGTAEFLSCKYDTGGTYTRQPYLRFDLSNVRGTVESAVLRLKVVDVNGSDDTHTAHDVSDDSWGENAITWNNRPALGASIASVANGGAGDWVEFDVTDSVDISDNLFSVALVSDGSVLVAYGSRESGSNAPQLVVQTSWSYGAWSNQYQLVLGPDGDDDSDGVSNMDEYALGGDPQDLFDTGYPPQFTVGNDTAVFVYPLRSSADSGLRYSVESTDNLVSNVWKKVETVDAAVNGLAPGLDLVTNQIPTTGKNEQFIRLTVEEK